MRITIFFDCPMDEGDNMWHNGMRQIHGFGLLFVAQTELLSEGSNQEPVGGALEPLLPEIPFKLLWLPPEQPPNPRENQ